MTIATATTIILSIDFSMSKWISDLLLPADEAQDFPTVENIIGIVSSWNAGEIADAIGSVIGAVCIDQYGEADMEAARQFSESKLIQRTIGLRRRSRLFTQRNLGRSGPVLKALREAIDIAERVLTQRQQFRAQLGRCHEGIEDSRCFQQILDDGETGEAASTDAYFAGVISDAHDRRTKTRDNVIMLDKLNGTFRTSRDGKRNSDRSRRAMALSRAMNAYHRRASMRRAYGTV